MILRSAHDGDLDALVALDARVFENQAWSRDSLRDELDQLTATRSVLVAEELGRIVGYVVLMVIGGTADLTRIAVEPDHRRNGLGRELVDEALSEAASRGCDQVMLEVAADNDAATRLYVDRGFHEVARRERYYPGDVDAVVLRKLIVGADPGRVAASDEMVGDG